MKITVTSTEELSHGLRLICEGRTAMSLRRVNKHRIAVGLPPLESAPDVPKDPGVLRLAKNFGKALIKHATNKGRKAPAEVQEQRLEICRDCPSGLYSNGKCRHKACGCNLKLKASWASEACPAGHWQQHVEAPPPKPPVSSHKRKPARSKPRPRTKVQYGKPISPTDYTGEVHRNLIMHLYPLASSPMWRWNVEQLLQRIELFNGRRIVSVALDSKTVAVDEVQEAFNNRVEIITLKNSPDLGEVQSFDPMLKQVLSDDPNSITFYCHGKGSSDNARGNGTGDRELLKRWAEWMYRLCLDDPEQVERLLVDHGCAGAFRKLKKLSRAEWYYSGTFFWVRDLFVAQRGKGHVPKFYFGVEAWPGSMFHKDEAAVLGVDDVGSLYASGTWHKLEKQLERRNKPEIRVKPSCNLTIITPTGDRPEAFALCERWMQRQTYRGDVQWVVTDDGSVPTTCTQGQEYIRLPVKNGSTHTLARNLREALPRARGAHIAIVEDDDWYCPEYLSELTDRLRDHPLVGMGKARYYWPRLARYRTFPKHQHASLCRTGFHRELLENVLHHYRTDKLESDIRLWGDLGGFIDPSDWTVSMKRMPGRDSGGGSPSDGVADSDLSVLRKWIGEDVEHYMPILPKRIDQDRARRENIVVYTVVLNGYDELKAPLDPNPDVRYVALTDQRRVPDPWEAIHVEATDNPWMQSRRLKILGPETFFPESDWTIYYDGQLQLAVDPLRLISEAEAWGGDADLYLFRHQDRQCLYREAEEVIQINRGPAEKIRPQVARYRKAGFPENAGLYLGGMLIRRPASSEFNRAWWREVEASSHRDQISLPVVLQRTGVRFGVMPVLWWQHFFHRHYHKSQQSWRRTARRSRSRRRSTLKGSHR